MKTQKTIIQRDEWIKKIVPDPKESPSVTVLTGFIGDSSEEGHVRIYFNLELSEFLDVSEADVLHSVLLSEEESRFGGSKIWVNKSAETLTGDPSKERIKAKFFEGNIYDSFAQTRGATDHFCSKYPYCIEPVAPIDRGATDHFCSKYPYCIDPAAPTDRGATDHFCSKYPYCITPVDSNRGIWTDVVCTDSCTKHCPTVDCKTSDGCTDSSFCKTMSCQTKCCSAFHTCGTEIIHTRFWTDMVCTDACSRHCPTVDCKTSDGCTDSSFCKTTFGCGATKYTCPSDSYCPSRSCSGKESNRGIWTDMVCTDACSRHCPTVDCKTSDGCTDSSFCKTSFGCGTKYTCPSDSYCPSRSCP